MRNRKRKGTGVLAILMTILAALCLPLPHWGRSEAVFTRLPDRTTLVMTIGCCDDGFDIIRKADGDNFSQLCADESLDADSCLQDLSGFIAIRNPEI